MILEQLLQPTSIPAFLDGHYLKLPFAHAGGCTSRTHLGDWAMIGRILARPEADIRASRQGALWEGGRVGSVEQARALLAEGYTIGTRHAERHDPALAELAWDFQQDFLAPIDVHVYCTPAGQTGLGWHYDAEEVFVLQTWGSKEWRLRKNTVNPWPLIETLPENMRHEREIMPVLRCLLKAGDWLYVPGGYWHRTEAGAEESISLSVGVLPACALDAYDLLRRQLLTSLRWRQRLPLAGQASPVGEAERLRLYRELFTELGRDLAGILAEETTARAFLEERKARLSVPGRSGPVNDAS